MRLTNEGIHDRLNAPGCQAEKGEPEMLAPLPLPEEYLPLRQLPTLRPPLKWAGGKRWLVPFLKPLWEPHQHRRLVEPLCGGLAVTLGLMPSRALLNDINPHTINLYRWIKRGLQLDIELCNEEALYYRHRERFNSLILSGDSDKSEAAQLFYYLNRTGYNGLCRFNRRGEFNVPFGRYKTINYADNFLQYVQAFAGWDFRVGDFEALDVRPDDFVYADPPYDVEFTQYSKEGFAWRDQVRLAEWLADHPGPVVVSNQATHRVVELYDRLGFTLLVLDAPRMISCTGDRTKAAEVLATKGIETMSPRDTRTGAVLEEMVLPALRRGGYTAQKQVHVGEKLGGGRHFVDVVATSSSGETILVSMKWQESSGTAEQKVPFEIMRLAKTIEESRGQYEKAYLVLGGPGWSLRDFYVSGGLQKYMRNTEKVSIMTLEGFVAKANGGKL